MDTDVDSDEEAKLADNDQISKTYGTLGHTNPVVVGDDDLSDTSKCPGNTVTAPGKEDTGIGVPGGEDTDRGDDGTDRRAVDKGATTEESPTTNKTSTEKRPADRPIEENAQQSVDCDNDKSKDTGTQGNGDKDKGASGGGSTPKSGEPVIEIEKEILLDEDGQSSLRIFLETIFPFLLAGFGLSAAGQVLGMVKHWEVFEKVSEVFILVPALLGLKGNLEMTLASRLSTQANLGKMESGKEQWSMIGGNLALIQAQAIVVGFLASIAAMILGWIPQGKFDVHHALLLCASSVLTASIASFVLGAIMAAVVVLSVKCKINPDNVATPIAASLGDLTTLSLLAGFTSLLYKAIYTQVWLAPVLIVIFLAMTPLWCVIAHKNKYTSDVLYTGWTPVIGAMVISSMGGLILDFTVTNYEGIAVFQPVVNGVGGNLVAVQASRLSTALHIKSTPGVLPENAPHGCPNPFTTFFGKGMGARTARVLIMLVIPGHLIFMYTIAYLPEAGHTSITAIFAAVYLSAGFIQVLLLLYIANWMVHLLWRRGNDPDNFSIPYLTALGDLLGTGLLAIAFHILRTVNDPSARGDLELPTTNTLDVTVITTTPGAVNNTLPFTDL